MAFDFDRLSAMFPDSYGTWYRYANFYDGENGDSGTSMFGAGTSVYAAKTTFDYKGYFYDARNQLKVGDLIMAGVSRSRPGALVTTAGVSIWVVTHVSASSVAGVTVAGVSTWQNT